jgi:hypothetical protein
MSYSAVYRAKPKKNLGILPPKSFLFVNGIFGSSSGWEVDAVNLSSKINPNWSYFSYFYWCGIFRWDQSGHINECVKSIANENISDVAGHSNGADILRRAIVEHELNIDTLNLIAGATDPDFKTNGLNEALLNGQIQIVRCFVSKNDFIIGSNWLLPWWWNRDLGKVGPKNVDTRVKDRVIVIQDDTCNHMTWVEQKLERTLEQIVC